MAFVIFSTGSLTASKQRTIGLRALVLATGLAMLAMLGGGFALGYWAKPLAARDGQPLPPRSLHLDEPEGRVLVERVGALSARMNRVESDASALAKRIGVMREFEARVGAGDTPASPRRARDEGQPPSDTQAEPSGGPLIPLAGLAGAGLTDTALGDDYGTGVARLEDEIERVEAVLSLMDDFATERNLEYMAFPSRLPLTGYPVNSGFGIRRDPMTGRLARHTGLDIGAPMGTTIYASAGGRVRAAGPHGPYGTVVEIDHGNGLVTRYAHTSRLYVRTGDLVLPHQRIAAVGSTGRSTGPHLHFEVIRNGVLVDPRNYLARAGH